MLANDAGTAAADDFFDFLAGDHRGVAGSGGGERAVGGAVFDGFLGVVEFQETELHAGSERVAAADAVEDFEIRDICGTRGTCRRARGWRTSR